MEHIGASQWPVSIELLMLVPVFQIWHSIGPLYGMVFKSQMWEAISLHVIEGM